MYYGRMWSGQTEASNLIAYGVLGEENGKRPGTYFFRSTTGIFVRDARILNSSSDNSGSGDFSKPVPGSTCVALFTSDGADCFIVGFSKPPAFNEDGDAEPAIDNPGDNTSSGDRVIKTSGGASFIMKRGGAVIIEGGPGTGVILNPVNNKMSLRSANFYQTANGFSAVRGRKEEGSTEPATLHSENYQNSLASPFERETVRHGEMDGGARKQFTLSEVTVVAGKEIVTPLTRETYYSDGSWVGEGPKYQWGGPDADEPIVLGNALVEAFNELIDIVKSLKVNTAWGPSTPPIPPTPIDLESLKSKLAGKILSTYLFSTKDPVDL